MPIAAYMPIALIVVSNVFYAICAKSTPADLNPMAGLTVTYLVGAVCSGGLYYAMSGGGSLLKEYQHLNWTTFLLGLVIVGLEAGAIWMYKVGWNVNTGQLLHSSILAVVLIFVGYFLYHEAITPSKLIGLASCSVGIFFLSR